MGEEKSEKEEENKEETEKISKLKLIIGISIAILISVLLICGYEDVVLNLALFIGWPLVCIFFILNSRRFIKYRRWYVDPTDSPFWLWPRNPDERFMTDYAWLLILVGIFFLAVFIMTCIGAILSFVNL